MNCESCNKEHDGQYGSGRFCSKSCAKSFSTKEKRQEINEKVRKKLAGRGHVDVENVCVYCNKKFKVKWNKRNQKTCSKKCSSKLKWEDKSFIKKMSLIGIKNHKNNKIKGCKKCIRCYYIFNNIKIRCDSKVEYSCLNFFESNFEVLNIERCNFFIEYEFENKIKRYLPDFYIKTKDNIYIVECKSYFKITDSVKNSRSWSLYYDTIELKKLALKKYCKEKNYIDFFYTKHLNRKFYDNCKPNIYHES